MYGHLTKGFRSGGYNLRNTSPTAPPGPFDEEEQDSLEAGLKSELAGGRMRVNVAAFHNRIYGMQRQVTFADAVGGGGELTVRASLAHRDDSEITDNNLGTLDGGNLVDASIAYSPPNALTFTLYGKNLLNEVLRRSDFDLSGLVHSTYSPLKEGRVLGVEVRGVF